MVDEIRVLHVDDEPEFVEMAASFLERAEQRLAVEYVNGPVEGHKYLSEHPVDCIVSDYDMPKQNGIEFLKEVRKEHPEVPFILYTGKGSEEIASEAISAGITDYLQKSSGTDQYTVLANRICNTVDRYRAEQTIEESERRLEETYERITDGFFGVDADWYYTYVNQAGAAMVGRDRDELIGSKVWDAFPDIVGTAFEDALRTARETGQRATLEEYYPAHDTWYDVQVYPDESGLSIFFKDITGQKEPQLELENLKERFKALTENSLDITAVLNEDGVITYLSPSIEPILGYEPADLLGAEVFQHIHPSDQNRARKGFEKTLESTSDETRRDEFRFEHADGSWVWLETINQTQSKEVLDGYVITARDISDRKEYEQQLETVIDSLPGFVFRHRLESGWPLEFVKGSVQDITGYTTEELENEVSLAEDIIHPDDRECVRQHTTAELETAGGYEHAYRIVTKDGSVKWIKEHGDVRENPYTGEEIFDGFITDITEQKNYEQQLEHERERFEALFTNFPEPTLSIDLIDGEPIIRSINPAFESIFGIDQNDAIGSNVNELIVPPDRMDGARSIDEQVTDGAIVDAEDRRQTANGERYFNIRSIPIGLDDGPDFFVVYADINERKRREEHFRRLHEVDSEFSDCDREADVYQVLVDSAEDVLEYDLAIADAARDDILIPMAISTELPDSSYYDETPIDADDNLAAMAYRSGETSLVADLSELDIAPADPEYSSVLTVPIGRFGIFQTVSKRVDAFDETDKDLAEVLVAHAREHLIRIDNRSELLERTEELERQNERLDEFASFVSHDLKNPLNVASGRLALAQEDCESEHLDEIERAHGRMGTLIENLLELAKVGDVVSQLDPVVLSDLIDRCWRNVETSDARLLNDVDMTIIADENRLQQLFENLFNNAIEHGGDDVEISVGELDDGFYIMDNGPGIPPDEQSSVFEVGYSTKTDGTGFGLNIVKQVVEAHDWEVEVGTGFNGGARFEIRGVTIDA